MQFTVALAHLRKHRPNWSIDYVAERGRHSAAFGLCNRVFAYDEFDGSPFDNHLNYDRVITATMVDNASGHADRPNTRVVEWLRFKFGIDWDAECGRYQVPGSIGHWDAEFMRYQFHRGRGENMKVWADDYLHSIGSKIHDINHRLKNIGYNRWRAVVVHTSGDSAPERKNLTVEQAKAIADCVAAAGRIPIILGSAAARIPPYDPPWGGDAEHLAALIGSCEAFVGIDSGPGKVASATETPSLICWTKHHPVQFHDPAPNTVHLVPIWHKKMADDAGCGAAIRSGFFEREYKHLMYGATYIGEVPPGFKGEYASLEGQVCEWLREVLIP